MVKMVHLNSYHKFDLKIPLTMGQTPRCQWSWSNFLTIDHGPNSRVSWSWSVPYPPQITITSNRITLIKLLWSNVKSTVSNPVGMCRQGFQVSISHLCRHGPQSPRLVSSLDRWEVVRTLLLSRLQGNSTIQTP